MNKVKVDFNKSNGLVKPLNGVCCAPYEHNLGKNQIYINKFFKSGNIPFCRTHDCCGKYGGTWFIDVSNIFRNFDLDENDSDNYDFYYSDEYITAIIESGCEVYYRLGETIEWGSKKYKVNPPKDFLKWTRICEHIIMHYNEGWANGFHYNIKYWEIWNEPENPGNAWGSSMWTGTKEEYFELYEISSKYLKKRFPNISIGGYGGCGFYAVTRENMPETHKGFVTYFTDFLEMCKNKECPLDFYSWHIYTGDEKEVFEHAKFVRTTLNEYGFLNTESHLNEWNIGAEGKSFKQKHTMEGGSFLTAVMCELQRNNLADKAMYYCFSSMGMYNGFFDQNDFSVSPSWYPFEAFGYLYSLKNSVVTVIEGGVYATAAKNNDEYAIMLSNYNCEDENTEVVIDNVFGTNTVEIYYYKEENHGEKEFSFIMNDKTNINLRICAETVVLIKILKN